MLMNDPTEGIFYKICDWIASIALLNVMWLLLTILGGVLFGWAPATVAVMSIWRQREKGIESSKMIKSLWYEYRQNFIQANGIGVILVASTASLIFYSMTVTSWPGMLQMFFWLIFLIVAIVYLIVAAFIFPVYIHYDISFIEYFKYAFVIGLAHIHYVIIILASVLTLYFASTLVPALFLLFSISMAIKLTTKLALIVFKKIETSAIEN